MTPSDVDIAVLAEPGSVDLYRMMVLIRRSEERLQILYNQGQLQGPAHLADGQEAISVGVASVLNDDDCTIGTYRGHGHILARGASVDEVFAEMMGKATGVCGGKGGSMHLTSIDHGFYGSYAIIGAQLPIAVGMAWAIRLRHGSQVVVCFFGDGATNIGAFHEALNLAAVWRLPVVFVCENNQYMEYTSITDVTAVAHPAADRAGAYGLERILVDGNDLEAVQGAARSAVARARGGAGPSLMEMDTYRLCGHSAADPGTYRTQDEVHGWRRRDPLVRYRQALMGQGISAEDLDAAESDAAAAVAAAVEFGRQSPSPDESAAWTHVWASEETRWRN